MGTFKIRGIIVRWQLFDLMTMVTKDGVENSKGLPRDDICVVDVQDTLNTEKIPPRFPLVYQSFNP